MATQKEVDAIVHLARTALKRCFGRRYLPDLVQDFSVIALCCQDLEKTLKAEGHVGVGLIVELFNKNDIK